VQEGHEVVEAEWPCSPEPADRTTRQVSWQGRRKEEGASSAHSNDCPSRLARSTVSLRSGIWAPLTYGHLDAARRGSLAKPSRPGPVRPYGRRPRCRPRKQFAISPTERRCSRQARILARVSALTVRRCWEPSGTGFISDFRGAPTALTANRASDPRLKESEIQRGAAQSGTSRGSNARELPENRVWASG